MSRRPWFPFYTSDWRGDAQLRACSPAARGLWIDMISVMHEADPYGFLISNGKPMDEKTLAKIAGISQKNSRKLQDELEFNCVFSRDETGVIYSRRMVRDEAIRNARGSGGVKALEHPNVPKPKQPKDVEKDTFAPEQKDTFIVPPMARARRVQRPETREQQQQSSVSNETGAGAPGSFQHRVVGNNGDVTNGQLIQLVRQRFYVPDGHPPLKYDEAREFTIFEALRKLNASGLEIADAIEGAALLRDAGGHVGDNHVEWLTPGVKLTMRALYNTKSGRMPLWGLAHQKLAETRKREPRGNGMAQLGSVLEAAMSAAGKES